MVARWRGGAYLALHSAEYLPAVLAVHVVLIEATMQQKGPAEGVEGVSEANGRGAAT